MARSYRHTAIGGNTTARSEKRDKQTANRRLRTSVRRAVASGREILPLLYEVSDRYVFAKDGKRWRLQFLGWKLRDR